VDTVKAVINLQEGIVELEGPQDFVEKYLELYRPDAKKWQVALSEKGESKTKEKAPAKRARAVRPKAGTSCTGRIRNLIDEGYFKDPRTSVEVRNWLKEQKGAPYSDGPVTAALLYLIKSPGNLRRFKEGKVYKYCNV
jgi:hypothetical protein